jgi:hypothetical protein
MAEMKERMAEQRIEERETVEKQSGSAAPDVSSKIEDSGAAAPRVAEETARAADKAVRHEMAEGIKEKLTGL